MQKKLKLAVIALCYAPLVFAQNDSTAISDQGNSEQAFTFTEAQLGEDDDMSQNVTILNSSSNIYASQVGYLFSPVRFRFRAFDQKYNDVYVNGVQLNDMESGQFRYSLVGGLNQMTKNVEFALPFESNRFSMTGMGGSNNYNFRAADLPTGHRLSLLGTNGNYTLRGLYTFGTGLNDKGWAFAGGLTYRWAKEGYVEGTFYNSLSYFLGVQKVFGDGRHSLSLSTWGAPTERATQAAGTDEMYWLANDRYYNAYWGYQNGKKRSSRIVNDFSPSAVLTWDWNMDDRSKLTTSLFAKYSMYKNTRLDYNNADNPHPNYWKNMPSSYYDVWNSDNDSYATSESLKQWHAAYDYWTASKANRQIDWDRLYYSNNQANVQGSDALYFVTAKHNDALTVSLAATFNHMIDNNKSINVGVMAATNKAMHYLTMEDLLGSTSYHNINTYALGTHYAADSDEVQYDLNHPNAVVREGDKFRYNYNILVNNAKLWSSYTENFGNVHYTIAAKLGYTSMQRDGKMRNGLAKDNSYGKSRRADFLDGGVKLGANINLGGGSVLSLGAGYEQRAPQAQTAFIAPEINNNFVTNLKNERVFSSEIGYQYENAWLHANVNAYYSRIDNGTNWQNFYMDDENSFTYVSLTGMNKEYYGVEAGLKFKVSSAFDIKLLGSIADAKLINNSHLAYMKSTSAEMFGSDYSGDYHDEVNNKGMRESGTPLTAADLGVAYHQGGWFINLDCSYFDRIYLSYSPNYRYDQTLKRRAAVDDTVQDLQGNWSKSALAQAKGHGGFLLSGSVGRSIYLRKGSLSINLTVNNILNNRDIVTGGYELSRSNYTQSGNLRGYSFSKNPMKFYIYGTTGMLNLTYKF